MKILVAYGTRPEWLKIKPLIMKFLEYGIEFECLFTGQHKDIVEYNKLKSAKDSFFDAYI